MSEIYRFLGRVLNAQGKYAEAVPLFRKAVDEAQDAVGADGPELTPAVHELGRALWRSGEKGEAQTTLARAVRLSRKAFEDPTLERAALGGESPASGETEFKAGCHDEWLLYQGEWASAAEGLRAAAAFEQREQTVLPDPEEMPVWELLAETETSLGNRAAARDAYARAAEQWEQRLSAGHPRAAFCRQSAAALSDQHAA